MIPIQILPQENVTPGVMLDSNRGIFEISGWSHPEDAIAFYAPVLEWLNKYAAAPNTGTNFHFKFQYYNTASAKQIFRIISMLEEVANKSKVKIYWHHDADDTDMLSSGERFSKMTTVPVEFVSE
ncbi:MAG: DUF1987 domain-containing protein [Bacteroidetes bacterium]|nr:DUF1987 domain-containing protein [Bacteroidota bacterium]